MAAVQVGLGPGAVWFAASTLRPWTLGLLISCPLLRQSASRVVGANFDVDPSKKQVYIIIPCSRWKPTLGIIVYAGFKFDAPYAQVTKQE